jgi:hypothetical protein
MAKRLLILLLLAGGLIGPGDLSSCGPFLPETLFTTRQAPLDPGRFFGGQLGILQPHYFRIYLVAAYRYLAGLGLSAADQQALAKPAEGQSVWSYSGTPAVQNWLRARTQLAGAPPIDRIDVFKTYGGNSHFAFILNCGDDAFLNAASTLDRRALSGASKEELKTWVAAQDQVFTNCAGPPFAKPGEPSIPAPLPAGAPRWLQSDRAYQIAAAHFYAGQFDAAAADFRRIAGDRASPWHAIAPYLAARALIRKATLIDPAAAPAAQQQLRAVLASPDAAPWQESARGLAQYLRAQTDAGAVLDELARTLETQKSGIAAAVTNYRLIFDHFENRGQNVPRDQDLTDWIATLQEGPADRALAQWRKTHSLPWLVAALAAADTPDPEMMAAAARVPESSPGYLTIAFHELRLTPPPEARSRLDALLARPLPLSARNLLLAARMRLARNWDSLLRYAPRTAAATYLGGLPQEPAPGKPQSYFDQDAARILNRQATLALLRDAARSPRLPANLQTEVAFVVWTRAIMLKDTAMVRQIAPVLEALVPDLKPQLDEYLAAPGESSRDFAAAWLMLNHPGLRLLIDTGVGRNEPLTKLDNLRDNWWCALPPLNAAGGEPPLNEPLQLLYRAGRPEAAFLTEAQRREAEEQYERLRAAPSAPTFMVREAVEWAEAHPREPRAPWSLHIAIRAAHFACAGDDQTDRWTERAFRLLHARYSDTQWARQTRYWYKVNR